MSILQSNLSFFLFLTILFILFLTIPVLNILIRRVSDDETEQQMLCYSQLPNRVNLSRLTKLLKM